MATYTEGPCRTFVAGAAIEQFLRVIASSSLVVTAAGANDIETGTLEEASFASGDVREVRLSNAMGTRKMVASGAISAGARVYAAASGKISATPSGRALGIAYEAATADNDVIEVLYDPAAAATGIYTIEQDVVIGDFTDNGDATGYVDITVQGPAGAHVLGHQAVVTEGFTGDTSASGQMGAAGNLNQFTATAYSVLAAGTFGAAAPGSGDSPVLAAVTTFRFTVTGGSDFGSITAGAATLKVSFFVP